VHRRHVSISEPRLPTCNGFSAVKGVARLTARRYLQAELPPREVTDDTAAYHHNRQQADEDLRGTAAGCQKRRCKERPGERAESARGHGSSHACSSCRSRIAGTRHRISDHLRR